MFMLLYGIPTLMNKRFDCTVITLCAIHNVPVCGCVGVCKFLVQTVSAFTSVAGYAGPVNIEVGHTDSCSSWTAGSAAVGQAVGRVKWPGNVRVRVDRRDEREADVGAAIVVCTHHSDHRLRV